MWQTDNKIIEVHDANSKKYITKRDTTTKNNIFTFLANPWNYIILIILEHSLTRNKFIFI